MIPFRGGETLPAVFAEQAAIHGGQLAAACPDRQFTYAELHEAATRIAGAIWRELGPGPEPAPLLLTQNSTFLAAMFGVLRAGKVFTTLEPGSPPARSSALLAELGARLLLTDEAHLPAARQLPGVRIMLVEEAMAAGLAAPAGTGPSPADPAWILWTSGSTGTPKGVTVDHGVAVRLCLAYARQLGITPRDRLSLFHPNLTWDIFGSLLTGASIFPLDIRRDGIGGVCGWVQSRQLTYFRAFPTTFRRAMEAAGNERFASVRLVHLSGEPVTGADAARFEKHFCPGSSLAVVYGSNEGGIVTMNAMPHGAAPAGGRVSIGRAIPGVELELRNEQGEPCREGETGEIVIRSPYLFTGYWHRPDLTAQAFPPGWRDRDERRFLSGDLAVARPGGELEYAGRKDSQVKVRGYRIELAEIELALQRHPAIRMAAASVFAGRDGEQRLAAYFVTAGEAPRDTELREFLSGMLPDHMQPDRFIRLAEMPMTGNGKADRKALPSPGRVRPDIDTPRVAPQPGFEAAVARLFEEALDLEGVGVHDSFFELGGKSLAALRVLNRIAETYGVTIPPRSFFESPTASTTAIAILHGLSALTGEDELERLLDEVEALEPKPLASAKGTPQGTPPG